MNGLNRRILLVAASSVLAAMSAECSFSGDDDDTLPPVVDDDDDTADDDDTQPECARSADCPGTQICSAQVCAEPVYPELNPEALDTVTSDGAGSNLLINGRRIRPAAPTTTVGTLPTNLELHPDETILVVNENGFGTAIDPRPIEEIPYGPYEDEPRAVKKHALRVIDTATMEVVQQVIAPNGSLFYGLKFDAAGNRLFAAGGEDQRVHVYNVTAERRLELSHSLDFSPCYVTDLALSPAEDRLYVSCVLQNKVKAMPLDTSTVSAEWSAGNKPHTLLPIADGARLAVANWTTGTIRPADGDTLTVLDTASGAIVASPHVGYSPEGLALSPDGTKVYASGNKSDDVWELDLATMQTRRLVSFHANADHAQAKKGIQPVMIALSPDGTTLYAASAGDNCVEVVDAATGEHRGRIPAEWYTNAVAVSSDGATLYVLNAKGRGDGPSDDGESVGRQLMGTVMKVGAPDAATLGEWSDRVEENNHRQQQYFDFSAGNDTPIPTALGQGASPIEHIFVIFKENMSYDATFGDSGIGRGKPEFTLWNEDVVPNHRKLAREFAIVDAFYTDGESSIAGHQWAMAAVEPDFLFRTWTLAYGDYSFPEYVYGLEPGTFPESQFFMPHLLDHGIGVRAYGGTEHFVFDGVRYPDALKLGYNGNLTDAVKDRQRADIFIEEFDAWIAEGKIRPYTYLFFPNNHTFGVAVGRETPPSWVADNDEALGMVVDAISHSPIWEKSVIFVFEDDSQSGYDHIDKHRSACLVIGPWVKRGYVSSVTYSMPNIHKTVELILGAPPMTRFDETASGMYDLFVAKPDATPYTREERRWPVEIYDGTQGDALVQRSARYNWDELDQAGEDAGEVLWRYMKPGIEPPATAAKR